MQRVESAARHAHRHPCLFIFLTALALRLCTALLLHLCNTFQGEPFDSSHLLASPLDGEDSTTPQSRSHSTLSTATLRWDAIHFVSIARDGYVWEQQLAFQPGWPLVLRIGSRVLRGTRAACHGVDVDWWSGVLGVGEIAQVGQVLASVSYAGAVVMLYKLTKRLTNPTHALTATTLYLLSPSPAVMSSPYGESLFALLVFSGYHLCTQRKFWLASVVLAMATSMRATGVINAGVIVWSGVFGMESPGEVMKRPLTILRRALKVAVPALIIISPFAVTQVYWYTRFCQDIVAQAPQWCHGRVPLVYSAVQKAYWNVGLLNYWTLAQLPNLVIASPILSVSFYGVYRFLLGNPIAPTQPTSVAAVSSWTLAPFYIVHLALTLLLTFSAHSQIALRLSVTDPVIWWTVASLAVRRDTGGARIARDAGGKAAVAVKGDRPTQGMLVLTGFGKVWVSWVVVYGAISIPLWAGHYPPA